MKLATHALIATLSITFGLLLLYRFWGSAEYVMLATAAIVSGILLAGKIVRKV